MGEGGKVGKTMTERQGGYKSNWGGKKQEWKDMTEGGYASLAGFSLRVERHSAIVRGVTEYILFGSGS